MTNKALIIGQLVANAYPADTRLLFQRYGITVPPTGKTILDASMVYGAPFIAELYQIASKSVSKFSGVTDTGLETEKLLANAAANTAAANAAAAAQPTGWDKFFSIFTKAGNVLATTTGAWNQLSNIFSGNQAVDTNGQVLTTEMMKLQLDAAAAAEAAKTKTYLLIGAGILVAVLVVMMYLKNK